MGDHLKSFGLGDFMGYDLPTGKEEIYLIHKRMYACTGGWRSTTIISNSIGQGEVLMTPIQLASMMATVANEGYYYTPHIIKKKRTAIDPKFKVKHQTSIDKYFKPMIKGLLTFIT
jgi:penicillin-binding protein 2